MRLLPAFLLFAPAALLAGCDIPATDSGAKAVPPAIAGGGPVVVELFQSQGCSACPPANAALNELADRSDVIALSYGVTYWDKLGWKDSFASPATTQRQRDYAVALHNDGVWTPQVVLNGSRDIVGNGMNELANAVAATPPVVAATTINADGKTVSLGYGKGNGSVWLVRYDPRSQEVGISSGENNGRTLPHKNIVRQLVKLGNWDGKATSFTIPTAVPGLRSVVLVQHERVGKIIAAKRL